MPDNGGDLEQLHSVPNWSPIADCLLLGDLVGDEVDVVSRFVDVLAQAFPVENRDRLYIGTGHGTEGALKELRTGLKTIITVESELEQYLSIYALMQCPTDMEFV
jgi:hypothetical protein